MATTKIKCPVEGVIELDRLPGVQPGQVEAVIDTPQFQRLRWIAQLGMSQYVFPGGNHSRLEHSLGTFQGTQHVLREFYSRGEAIPRSWHLATALAALLHDIGHGPFSHSFEKVTGIDHEDFTKRIVTEDTEVTQALEAIEAGLATKTMQVLNKAIPDDNWKWLSTLVSSQLDCDRIDYLRRDSLHTGADYGRFDRDWLFRGLAPAEDRSNLVVRGQKGIPALEQYLIGRYHMYRAVYFHKTTRGFELVFRALCARVADRGPGGGIPDTHFTAYLYATEDDKKDLSTFCQLTDVSFLALLPDLAKADDKTICFLAGSLLRRQPLRCVGDAGDLFKQVMDEARGRASAEGLEPDSVVFRDEPKDLPYKPYEHVDDSKSIRVATAAGLRGITHFSPTIHALSKASYFQRIYSPN